MSYYSTTTLLQVTECIIYLSSKIPLYFAVLPVPEAVVTVLCTPDDGCGWHPKHVEWTCWIIDCFVLHLIGQL
jgi:hypothetical protein